MFRRALVLCLRLLPAIVLGIAPTLARADDLQLVEPGKLTWGTAATFMPFEFMQDGKAVGFDVDMMADLAKRIHLPRT